MNWVIQSQFDFYVNLPANIFAIYSFDITQCYEAIPHDGDHSLLMTIKDLCKMAKTLGYHGFDKEGQGSKKGIPLCSFDDFWKLNKLVLDNCFTKLGNCIRKQIKGIPMGYSCSPLWCNLYFMYYEILFIKKLARLGCFEALEAFYLSFRYIDDLCFINNYYLLEFISSNPSLDPNIAQGIYPLNIVQLKPTHNLLRTFPCGTTFLNCQIKITNHLFGFYDSSIAWKKDKLPCNNISFIHVNSNRPKNLAYKVCSSQILPILYANSSEFLALCDIHKLIHLFGHNGFKTTHIHNLIVKFILANQFLGIRIKIQTLIILLQGRQ